MATKKEIVVLGAGVVGLHTAVALLENGFGVTIVAKHWPGDEDIGYCSMKAGAHWRSHASSTDLRSQKFESETYKHWQSLVQTHPSSSTGIELIPSRYIYNHPPSTHWWTPLVTSFHSLSPTSLPPGSHSATSCDSFCISPQRYLDHLLGRLGDLGGKTITAEVADTLEALSLPGTEGVAGLVNCTGLAAGALCGDENVFPTRGQTVLVRGEVKRVSIWVGDGWTAYVVRRPGEETTVLGGCYQKGDWNGNVDPEMSRVIMERCAVLAPELLVDGKFDVVSEQVGLRPSREGGPRIEVEWVKVGGERKFICHHYGHSGGGYQASYGSAREALRLIQEAR